MLEIRLAQQGMAMQEGTIARWLKNVGDYVAKDEVVAEVETAKAIVEVTAPGSGLLRQIFVAVDETVPVHTILALIEEDER